MPESPTDQTPPDQKPANPTAASQPFDPQTEGIAARTTRYIAYILMSVYGLCLITILVTAITIYWLTVGRESGPDDRWLLIFKDGFAFLGGLLATIVGYYFGNRNVGDALEKAKQEEAKAGQAQAVAQTIKGQMASVSKKNDPVEAGAAPTISEEGLQLPTTTPASDA